MFPGITVFLLEVQKLVCKYPIPFCIKPIKVNKHFSLNSNAPRWESWKSSLLISFQTGESLLPSEKLECKSITSVAISSFDSVVRAHLFSLPLLPNKFKHTRSPSHMVTLESFYYCCWCFTNIYLIFLVFALIFFFSTSQLAQKTREPPQWTRVTKHGAPAPTGVSNHQDPLGWCWLNQNEESAGW